MPAPSPSPVAGPPRSLYRMPREIKNHLRKEVVWG